VSKADNLTAICEPIVWKMWELRRLTTLWASMACYRDSFTFLPYEINFLVNLFHTLLHMALKSKNKSKKNETEMYLIFLNVKSNV
jgi:hypothetical protein